jgi:hypothetical protein
MMTSTRTTIALGAHRAAASTSPTPQECDGTDGEWHARAYGSLAVNLVSMKDEVEVEGVASPATRSWAHRPMREVSLINISLSYQDW